MTIGFIVSFFDFRKDVRKVIELLSKDHTIVIFFNKREEDEIINQPIENVEYRVIEETNGSAINKILERIYLLFKKLPASKSNYFLMELFKASNLKNIKAQKKALNILKIQRLLPRFMSYDLYLKLIKPSKKTLINDVDKFIFFTEFANDFLLSRIIKEKKSAMTYVYSWDHPCKHSRFTNKMKYLCWSEGIKNDIVKLQNINEDNIIVSGASQLSYLHTYINSKTENANRTYNFEYIYFGCAIGITPLVPGEIAIIKELANLTLKVRPDLKFVVRPYPLMEQWNLYEELKEIPNIIIDTTQRDKVPQIGENSVFEKYEKIQNAVAFIHLGTTLGLEACYTDTPSFIVDFGYKNTKGLSLYAFIHQYQNDKYLAKLSTLNQLNSLNDFKTFLLTENPHKYLELNHKVREEFPLNSFAEFSENLLK